MVSFKSTGRSLAIIIGLFIVAFATNIIALLLPAPIRPLISEFPAIVRLCLELTISIVIAITLFTLLNRYLLKNLLPSLLKAPNIFNAKIAVVWSVFTGLLLIVVIMAFTIIGTVTVQSVGETTLLLGLLNGFLFSLQPGIIEELTYRWFFYGTVKKKFGYRTAVIATGIGFALIHMNQVTSVADAGLLLLAAFAVSYLFITIYEVTGTIWAGVVVHSLWDMFTQGRGVTLINAIEGKAGTEMHVIDIVADHSNSLLSGGSFGVESSLITTAAYVLAAIAIQQIATQLRR